MTRIGIAIGADMVSAVVVRGRHVDRSVSALIGDTGIAGAVDEVIRKLPRPRWPRPRVWIAMDDPRSHVKMVQGLPPVTDARVLASIIAAAPRRFFVNPNGALATTNVQVIEPGTVRAAAFALDVLKSVQDVCSAVGLRIAAVAPTEVALTTLAEEDRYDAFAPALGVTGLEPSAALVYRPRRPSSRRTRTANLAKLGAAVTLAVTGVALLSPLLAMRAQRHAHDVISSFARTRVGAIKSRYELDDVVRSVNTVAAFEQSRLSMTLLLSRLNQALPFGSAITTMKVDTSGVTLVALVPHAADVVRDIQEIPGIQGVELVGSVTRETVNTATLERVTVRFRTAPDRTVARGPLKMMRNTGKGE
jgi:hypothetical protein